MADPTIEIPNRAFFKASEVCEIAQLQSYVLRTWELEFPSLGVPRPGSGQRIYRRQDVEQVLRIKHLVFSEGLTLAGARRRLEGDPPAVASEDVSFDALIAPEVRAKLADIRRGLRSILTMLSPESSASEVGLAAAVAEAASEQKSTGELLPFDQFGREASVAGRGQTRQAKTVRRVTRGSRQPKRRG